MEIKEVYNDFFQEDAGIIIDDAYDLYKRNLYVQFINNKNITFIYSQDNDLSYLKELPHIKYISISRNVDNLEGIYYIERLKGIRIYSSSYSKIDFSKFPYLEKIDIVYDSKISIDFKSFSSIKLEGFKLKSIAHLFDEKTKVIEFSNAPSLQTLDGIPKNIEEVKLDYCPKLTDISELSNCTMLRKFTIIDCDEIDKLYDILKKLKKLENLRLYCQGNKKLKSVDFIIDTPLQSFETNYSIVDNDLKPLLQLKDCSILKWKKKYNLRDIDLPHVSVLYKSNGFVVTKKLSEINNDLSDPNIIWLDHVNKD